MIPTTTWSRQPIKVVGTPYPATPSVAIYRDTWDHHIEAYRKMGDAARWVEEALSSPSRVLRGTSVADNLLFIHPTVTSPRSNNPFVVVVVPHTKPLPLLATMGFRRDLKGLEGVEELWRREEGSQ